MENTTSQTTSSQMNVQPNRPFDDTLFSVAEFNRRFASDEKFREFATQVYHYLDKMKVNKILRLDRYKGEKLEWIVLTAAAFIAEGVHAADYSFTDDFMGIQHIYAEPEFIEECRRSKYGELNIDQNENK